MKSVGLFLIFCLPLFSFSQTDFTVAAGARRTLTATERTLSLKTLSLGDNCVIIIPASMDGWTVTATDASIGTGVKIIGQGINGSHGSAGATPSTAGNCLSGLNGGAGGNGSNGTPGKTVFLNLRIRKIGSLLINVTGGDGGNGGTGGGGGKGGNATCSCNAGTGGSGANGGRAGSGGNGGNVTVSYSAIGNTVISNSHFTVENAGGVAGLMAAAGSGGTGGTGITCTDQKSAAGQAGKSGSPGLAGAKGVPGNKGITTLQSK